MPQVSEMSTEDLKYIISQDPHHELREAAIAELISVEREIPQTEEVAKFRGGIRPTRPSL
jgi:hypothetical protein